jgi:hypothetical protein
VEIGSRQENASSYGGTWQQSAEAQIKKAGVKPAFS